MKTTITILCISVAVVFIGCSKSDLIAKRVDTCPQQVKSVVLEELNSQYNQDIEVLTMDVFHPVITQIEPKRREYIDSSEYRVFLQVKNDSLIEFCSIHMNKYYNVYLFLKERSWPTGVPEKRKRMHPSSKRK